MTVWKFELVIRDYQDIEMPAGSELLSVQMQDGGAMLWARVDASKKKITRRIDIRGTGHLEAGGIYVGTIQMAGGALVWHVFDRGER